jgi:hypothetical protein
MPYKFFSYNAPAGLLEIAVGSSSGNADLYVSTTNEYPRSTSSYDFSNTAQGTSTVIITVPAAGATYYIGVNAVSSGTFTVKVRYV